MPKQIADGHGPLAGSRGKQRKRARGAHRQVAPLRDKAMHRVFQRKQAPLVEHHQGHRGDGLAHRVDTEDGVLTHRRVALKIAEPRHIQQPHATVPGNERNAAGQLAGLDIAVAQVLANARQLCRIEAQSLGIYLFHAFS